MPILLICDSTDDLSDRREPCPARELSLPQPALPSCPPEKGGSGAPCPPGVARAPADGRQRAQQSHTPARPQQGRLVLGPLHRPCPLPAGPSTWLWAGWAPPGLAPGGFGPGPSVNRGHTNDQAGKPTALSIARKRRTWKSARIHEKERSAKRGRKGTPSSHGDVCPKQPSAGAAPAGELLEVPPLGPGLDEGALRQRAAQHQVVSQTTGASSQGRRDWRARDEGHCPPGGPQTLSRWEDCCRQLHVESQLCPSPPRSQRSQAKPEHYGPP